MKDFLKNKYPALILIGLFLAAFPAKAFDFLTESGIKKTAEGAGYDLGKLNSGNLPEKIGKIVGVLLAFLGVIFLLLIIYAGYLWMTAGGNEQAVERAKKIIKEALIGLLIVFSAYAVTYFVGQQLVGGQ